MVKKTPWVERTFQFNFPIGVFPCIIERLRGTPARVIEMTTSLSHAVLTTRVENSWSIQEHVGHLVDLDDLHEGRIEDFLSRAPVLRAADMQNKKTHNAGHNQFALLDIAGRLKTARQRFIERLEKLSEPEAGLVSLHPRLQQPMRLIDMAYFVCEHDDHHLARITELKRMLR